MKMNLRNMYCCYFGDVTLERWFNKHDSKKSLHSNTLSYDIHEEEVCNGLIKY